MKRIFFGALLGATVMLSGCYPDTPDYLSEYDLVYTDRSPSFDFKAATTFSLPDSVVLLTGDLAEGELPEKVSAQYGDAILARIRQNLVTRGWVEVPTPQEADVVMLPSAVKTLNVDMYYYYGGYWGWYYPYYGYGWYYPGYYPTYTSYTTGSLLIQMVVPNDISATNNIPVVWLSVINGLLEGSTVDIVNRFNTNIDQAFKQSDYLNK